MDIIDFHTHTFPDGIAERAIAQLSAASHTKPFTDGTADGLRASMKRAGISRSVVLPVATSPRQVVKVNDAARLVNEHTEETGLISFGCIHPELEGWREELDRIRQAGLPGIKLHPYYQAADFDDPRSLRILYRAAELDLPVLVHAGRDVGYPDLLRCSPAMVRRALNEVGPMTLILAHMGGWRCWDEVLDLLPGTGVYLDTSFSLGRMTPLGDGYYDSEASLALLDQEQFMSLTRAFGPERILFGSDSPWAEQRDALKDILALPLTEEDRRQILYGNAARLLKLRTA